MGKSGDSGGRSTTETGLPPWLQPYAQNFISSYQDNAMVKHVDADGQVTYEPVAMPSNLNLQTAPFTDQQTTALGNISDMTPGVQGLANIGGTNAANTLGGAYLNPDTNPYLSGTFDAAARKLTDAYSTSTAPSIMAAAQRSGQFGGSAMNEAMALSRYGLGENLGNLASNIYGTNYANERANQLNTMNMLPNTINSLYAPQQALMGAGTAQQAQTQTEMDTGYANAANQAEWPFNILSGYGGAIGQAAGGGGTSTTTTKSKTPGGMSALCSETYRQGRMSEEMWIADSIFGENLTPETLDGYRLMAVPVAKAMAKSRILSALIIPLVILWGKEMYRRTTGRGDGSYFGKCVLWFGIPLCSFLGRCKYRFLYWHTFFDAPRDYMWSDSRPCTPICNAQSLSVNSEKPISASIDGLLSMSRPTTIFRRIRAIIVLALNLHLGRALSHISKKVFKAVFPAVANGDASASIVFITNSFRICAALFHGAPRTVSRGAAMIHRVPVSHISLTAISSLRNVMSKASAASGVATSNSLAVEHGRVATTTLTQPSGFPVAVSTSALNDRQSPKSLTRHIFQIVNWHRPQYTTEIGVRKEKHAAHLTQEG